jgi:hypothetical protein
MRYEPTPEWNAFVIVAMVLYRYVFVVAALAVVFAICTASHIDLAQFDTDRLVAALGHFWLSLPAQYAAIKLTGGEISARNYAVFNLLLSCLYPVLLVHTACYYNAVRKKCALPKVGQRRDLLICALVTVAAVALLLLDYPQEHPGVSTFRVDAHGFYYFHQAFFAMGIIIGPMMSVIFVMKRAFGLRQTAHG